LTPRIIALKSRVETCVACRQSPKPTQSEGETSDPLIADHRNFYKVEKWTKDGAKVERMLFAGSNLDKARALFESEIKRRPRIRLTIRQRTRVLDEWPRK
jgi:hypothetical protein